MSAPPVEPRPRRLVDRLFEPVDVASLALFRIAFGAIVFWEVWRFFDSDWIRLYYIARDVHFKYFGFGWVTAWPGDWMYVHFAVVGALALCVMSGLWYRVTSVLLAVGFAYWFLLDKTRYLNHLYLVLILCVLMAALPAHRAVSIDAWRRPAVRSDTVPAWCLWLLRGQLGLVYVYAAVAKLNGDWLSGAPMGAWLANRADMPLIGPLLGLSVAVPFFAWGGMLFDLLIVPLLLWRRTQVLGLALSVFFHVTNKWLFDIGIFPVLMLAATTLLLSPSWPRRVNLLFAPTDSAAAPAPAAGPSRRSLVTGLLALWFAVQLLVPLRHWVYPGNVAWTEEGHCFSWRMKLRDKDAEETEFTAVDRVTGDSWQVPMRPFLSSRQRTVVGQWPDLAHQYAHFMADHYREQGHDVEIRVRALVSLNGREAAPMIDPEVDLVARPRQIGHDDWILPLEVPLPAPDASDRSDD